MFTSYLVKFGKSIGESRFISMRNFTVTSNNKIEKNVAMVIYYPKLNDYLKAANLL